MPSKTLKIDGSNGRVSITTYGAPASVLSNPLSDVSQVYFHSDLPYLQIKKKINAGTISFPTVSQGIITWSDGSKGCSLKIICTKLYELGLMPEELYEADQKFGERLRETNPDIYNGYIAWAQIAVDWMNGEGPKMMPWMTEEQFSSAAKKWSIGWTYDIVMPWAEEMAYQIGARTIGSKTGKAIMLVGNPICKVIGVWQRWFGPSKKPAGIVKGAGLILVIALFKLLATIGNLIEGRK